MARPKKTPAANAVSTRTPTVHPKQADFDLLNQTASNLKRLLDNPDRYEIWRTHDLECAFETISMKAQFLGQKIASDGAARLSA